MMGWYREGSVIGIVFLDMGTINEPKKSRILLKIHKALHESLGPAANAEVKTSFQLLPCSYGNLIGFEQGWGAHGHQNLEVLPEDETAEAVSVAGILER